MNRVRRAVKVVDYNPERKKVFQDESKKITELMPRLMVDIHHIGSTAIPFIKAKPITDIMPVVKNIAEVDEFNDEMRAIGYKAYGEYGLVGRRYFVKFINEESDERLVHAHFYGEGNPEVEQHLLFRDYMLNHPKEAMEYSALKEQLVQQYTDNPERYRNGKDRFIKEILNKAGFNKFYLRMVNTDHEWKKYHSIRKIELYYDADYDQNHPSITDPNNNHYVFYRGGDIIGVIQTEHLDDQRVAFRNIAIDGSLQNRGYGSILLKQAEEIVKNKGYKLILLHAAEEAYGYYQKNDYVETEFQEDKQALRPCIDMGKVL